MPATLDPLISSQLSAFSRRWRSLALVRGLCAGLIVAIFGLMAGAVADWAVVLTDDLRLWISGASYLGGLAVFWLAGGRRFFFPPEARDMARRLEKSGPGLQGRFLAAFELGNTADEAKWDSEDFRRHLQNDVAGRVRDLDMGDVLPTNLLHYWLKSVGAVLAVAIFLSCLPGFPFARLFARAALPFAGIERPSRVRIVLVSPTVDTRWLPVGDEVEVVVDLTGPRPDKVFMEVFGGEERKQVFNLAALGENKYAGRFVGGSEKAEFRVRAGDGATPVISIPTRPRPHVVHFEKTYRYPDYARLPEREVKEQNGDIAALEGTTVRLRMKVNQPVQAGELLVESDGRTNIVTLAAPQPDLVQAEFAIEKAATYQVRLVAVETGFGNRFSPRYEIKAQADLVPKVTLTHPKTEMVVSPDERMVVTGKVTDDYGLSRVVHAFRVNTGAWQEIPLPLNNPTNVAVSREWDLILLGVNVGDRITTKLAATDVKGNRSESSPVQIVIGNNGYDLERAKVLAQWTQVHEALSDSSRAVANLQMTFSQQAVAKIRGRDPLQRQQTAAGVATGLEETDRQLERVQTELNATLGSATAGREAADLSLLGKALGKARRELVPEAGAQQQNLTREKDPGVEINRLMEDSRKLASQVNEMEQGFKDVVAAKLAGAAAEYFEHLATEQKRMNEQVEAEKNSDPNAWLRLARRQSAATAEIARGEELVGTLAGKSSPSVSRRAVKARMDVNEARDNLESRLKHDEPGPKLADPSKRLAQRVEQSAKDLRSIARELALHADKARNRLAKLSDTPQRQIQEIENQMARVASAEKSFEAARRAKRPLEEAMRAFQEEREALERASASVADQLEDRAQTESGRKDGDHAFAAELGQAARAVQSLAGKPAAESATTRAKLAETKEALGAIEAARNVKELEDALKDLARRERWEPDALDNKTERPRDWNWIARQLQPAQVDARNARLPEAVDNAISQIMRDPVNRTVGREMLDRQNFDQAVKPLAEELDRLADYAAQARSAAEPAREQARLKLANLAPGMSERMQALASAAGQQQQSLEQASNDPRVNRQAAESLRKAQDNLAEQVAEAQGDLRREADAQNVFSPKGRELARDRDDAIAMMAGPARAAQQAAQRASEQTNTPARQNELAQAAQRNEELANSLQQLAKHFRNAETGNAAEMRPQLRSEEERLGLREEMDRRFGPAAELQQLAQANPAEMSRELARAAGENDKLRGELNRMARENVAQAQAGLEQARRAQAEAAQQAAAADNSPENRHRLREQAKALGGQAQKLAGDLPRGGNAPGETGPAGQPQTDRAREALQQAASEGRRDAGQTAEALARQAGQMERQLRAAEGQLRAAEAQPGNSSSNQSAQPGESGPRKAAQQAGQMAAAAQRNAETLRAMAGQESQQTTAVAAGQQQAARASLEQSAQSLQQAARQAEAAGSPQEAAALRQVGEQARQLAGQQMAQAEQALRTPDNSAAANTSANRAMEALEAQRAGMEQPMRQFAQASAQAERAAQQGQPGQSQPGQAQPGQAQSGQAQSGQAQSGQAQSGQAQSGQAQPGQAQPGQAGPGESSSGQESSAKWLARAMNAMAEAGESKNGALPVAARDALQAAMQAEAGAIRLARQCDAANQPGQESGAASGATAGAGGDPGMIPAVAGALPTGTENIDWAQLPPRLAKDLRESLREGTAEEYREQIAAYFKLLADRAVNNR